MSTNLKRELSTTALIFFVIGDILGAGIYSLVGKIAGFAGHYIWISFVIAMIAASLTGLSYVELSSRYPKAAGEALFTLKAFKNEHMALVVGWLVFFSGIASMATVSHAFAAYVQSWLTQIPKEFLLVSFLSTLAIVNHVGINESSRINIVCTTVEVCGLIIVITSGLYFIFNDNTIQINTQTLSLPDSSNSWLGVFQGATLAFFAFIGFEDLANIAEEAKTPQKSLPIAIFSALLITGLFYMTVSVLSTLVVDPVLLSQSDAPLLLVVKSAYIHFPTQIFIVIAIFAITNTALLNNIMASRILYGMAKQGLIVNKLNLISPKRKTPTLAIFVVFILSITFALMQDLKFLAQTTSMLILSVFVIINASLVKIQKSADDGESDHWRCPKWIPYLGIVSCISLMAFVSRDELLTFCMILLTGLTLVIIRWYKLSRD